MQQIILITLSDSIYEISDHYIPTLPCVIPAIAEQGETIINKTNKCGKMPVRNGKSCSPAGEYSIKSRALRDFVSFCCSADPKLPCGTIQTHQLTHQCWYKSWLLWVTSATVCLYSTYSSYMQPQVLEEYLIFFQESLFFTCCKFWFIR